MTAANPTAVGRALVRQILQAAVGAVAAKSAVRQFPLGSPRPECVDFGVRQLTQRGDAIRDGWIEQTVRAAGPFDGGLAAGFSLKDTQQEQGAHLIFVADALEPRGQGLIDLWSGAYRPNARCFVQAGSIRSRSLTRSTIVASMNSLPSSMAVSAAHPRSQVTRPVIPSTTPGGRALAGMLAVFAEFERDILRDRVKAGIAQARKEGRPHGRPPTMQQHASEIATLFAGGVSKRKIATRLSISRASVRRMLPSRRGTVSKQPSKRT